MLVFIEIVGTHDAPSLTLLHGSLEGRQVDLMQGTVGDDDVHLMTIFLVVVQGVVLHTGSDTLRLEASDVWHYHPGCQPGVFAHILEVTASKRCAIDVHARTEHHAFVAVESLLAQALAIEAGHTGIPGGGKTGKGWEGHARVVGLSGLYPLIPEHVRTHAMRAVVCPEVRESEAFHTRRREFRLRMNDGNLLVERHATQGIVDALFDGLRLVEVDGGLCHCCHCSHQRQADRGQFFHCLVMIL